MKKRMKAENSRKEKKCNKLSGCLGLKMCNATDQQGARERLDFLFVVVLSCVCTFVKVR